MQFASPSLAKFLFWPPRPCAHWPCFLANVTLSHSVLCPPLCNQTLCLFLNFTSGSFPYLFLCPKCSLYALFDQLLLAVQVPAHHLPPQSDLPSTACPSCRHHSFCPLSITSPTLLSHKCLLSYHKPERSPSCRPHWSMISLRRGIWLSVSCRHWLPA